MENEIQTTYPAWQTTIREAQAVADARWKAQQAEEDAKREREQAELDARYAPLLKTALAHFGIDVEPTKNEWIAGTLKFYLAERPEPYIVRNYDEYPSPRHFGDKPIDTYPVAWFRLVVEDVDAQALWEDYSGALSDWVEVECQPLDGDWTDYRCRLAEAIDNITAQGQKARAHVAMWEARRQQDAEQPKPAPRPTLNEQLVLTIRALARDEIRREREAEYGSD